MKVGHYRPEEPRMLGNARRWVQEREDRRRHVLVACAVTLALSSCTDADSGAPRPEPTNQPAGRVLQSLPPTTQPAAGSSVPELVVGITKQGLVLARSSNGSIIRTIVPAKDMGRAAGALALRPDGLIYYTTKSEDDCYEIRSVRSDGSGHRKAFDGFGMAVSPDGLKLAWSRQAGCGAADDRFFVMSLETGERRSWPDTTEVGSFGRVEWDYDSRRLFVSDCGADSCKPHRFDTNTDAKRPGFDPVLPAEFDGRSIGFRHFLRRDTTIIFTPQDGDPAPGYRYPMLEADPRTGRLVSTLFADGRIYEPMAFDRSGGHLLIRRNNGPLYRWTAGKLHRIGNGFTSAVWYEPEPSAGP